MNSITLILTKLIPYASLTFPSLNQKSMFKKYYQPEMSPCQILSQVRQTMWLPLSWTVESLIAWILGFPSSRSCSFVLWLSIFWTLSMALSVSWLPNPSKKCWRKLKIKGRKMEGWKMQQKRERKVRMANKIIVLKVKLVKTRKIQQILKLRTTTRQQLCTELSQRSPKW